VKFILKIMGGCHDAVGLDWDQWKKTNKSPDSVRTWYSCKI